MRRSTMLAAVIAGVAAAMFFAGIQGRARAHCEVPCGIYDDHARIRQMLEDTSTIEKAVAQIAALAGQHDAQAFNQAARWVATKEDHATSIQHTIAQYFMTQRIKADDEKYVPKLTAAHAVLVQAMKCKQVANVEQADALRAAILAFYEAYEGKKPQEHEGG